MKITIHYENLQGPADLVARLRMDADIFEGVAPKIAAKTKKVKEEFKPEDMDPPAVAEKIETPFENEPVPPVKKVTAPTITIKIGEVIKGFQTFAGKHGRPKALTILQKYGAKNVNDIPQDKYPEILKVLNG